MNTRDQLTADSSPSLPILEVIALLNDLQHDVKLLMNGKEAWATQVYHVHRACLEAIRHYPFSNIERAGWGSHLSTSINEHWEMRDHIRPYIRK